MKDGARTPEDLETLLEDTLVLENREALAQLFEAGALMAVEDGHRDVRGADEIAQFASGIWTQDHTYLADPRRVMQTRDLALVITSGGVNVARRGSDGSWRYVFLLVETVETKERKRDE